jgi:hypothetical protein
MLILIEIRSGVKLFGISTLIKIRFLFYSDKQLKNVKMNACLFEQVAEISHISHR